MIKLNFLICVVWLVNCTVSTAQNQAFTLKTTTSNEVNGSPYLNESFVIGQIYFGKAKSKVPVRYNIYKDEMEYPQNGLTLSLDPTSDIKKVCFGNTTFVYDKFEYRGKTKHGYLILLDSGKVMLFSKKIVVFEKARAGGALDGTNLPARFAELPDVYFYKIGDGDLKQVDNIKNMIAHFPDKQEVLSQFAKQEKISPRKEKGLIRLVQYYNSLEGNMTVSTSN